MTIKASGRSALILAAGLWIGFGTGLVRPSLAAAGDTGANGAAAAAATPDNSAKHGSHHKKEAHRKSDKPADKSASDAKAASDGGDNAPPVPSSQMPPTIANANAQLTSTDSPADSAMAMSERVNNILQGKPEDSAGASPAAGTPVVAADQLNDVDRALHEATPPATPVALASADTPVPASPPAQASSSSNSSWDQASLIGKVFIGFGALLTMASAARMFMA
jgi:hypothetical protein